MDTKRWVAFVRVAAFTGKGRGRLAAGATAALGMAACFVLAFGSMTSFAAPLLVASSVVTSKMNQIYEIIAALVSAVGAIILLWSVFELGISMGDNQGVMQAGALKRIGGGVLMVIAPQIIAGLAL